MSSMQICTEAQRIVSHQAGWEGLLFFWWGLCANEDVDGDGEPDENDDDDDNDDGDLDDDDADENDNHR